MENDTNPPLWIKMMSWAAESVIKSEDNLADGHIEKFNWVGGKKGNYEFNRRMNEPCRGGYDRIWVHIADDWFKEIGKWQESMWNGQ